MRGDAVPCPAPPIAVAYDRSGEYTRMRDGVRDSEFEVRGSWLRNRQYCPDGARTDAKKDTREERLFVSFSSPLASLAAWRFNLHYDAVHCVVYGSGYRLRRRDADASNLPRPFGVHARSRRQDSPDRPVGDGQ